MNKLVSSGRNTPHVGDNYSVTVSRVRISVTTWPHSALKYGRDQHCWLIRSKYKKKTFTAQKQTHSGLNKIWNNHNKPFLFIKTSTQFGTTLFYTVFMLTYRHAALCRLGNLRVGEYCRRPAAARPLGVAGRPAGSLTYRVIVLSIFDGDWLSWPSDHRLTSCQNEGTTPSGV